MVLKKKAGDGEMYKSVSGSRAKKMAAAPIWGTAFAGGLLFCALCVPAADQPIATKPNLASKALELMGGTEEIVFVERELYKDGHYYRNFGGDAIDPNDWYHAPDGSRLCTFNLRTKKLTVVFEIAKGDIRDPRVNYAGDKLLMSYRKAATRNYNLYEINIDGSGLKQLTFGEKWDDFGPEYLPDGGIIFVSSRGKRFIPCNHSPNAQLFRMNGDGSGILCLSANNVRDDRPAVMRNGQIVYDRWEYVDAAIALYHDIWTMNPDGTSQMIAFGGGVKIEIENKMLTYSKCDPMAIPGSDKIVCTYSPPSGLRENAGHIMLIDLKGGPDAFQNAKQISPTRNLGYHYVFPQGTPWYGGGRVGFRDPFPLSESCFLTAEDKNLIVMDDAGNTEIFYTGPKMVHDPRVLRSRPREPIIPGRIDLRKTNGTFVVTDVYLGRPKEMEGLTRGTIKSLLILEDLPKPVSYFSLPGLLSMDGTHTLRRVLGTVPVEADGSAAFEAPAQRALYFVALDENGIAVKRMQSYTMIMPGETQSCLGCHEHRTATATPNAKRDTLLALTKPPHKIQPIPNVPEVFDYPRDIQPIWDRHCVSCHNPDKLSGRVNMTGDRAEWFSQSYYALFAFKQVKDMFGRYAYELREHKPYGFGTGASPLMKKIDTRHHEVQLTEQERDTVRLWIEASATFTGTYAVWNTPATAVAGALVNNGNVMIGKPLEGIILNRCILCHDTAATIGRRVRKPRMNSPKHCWNLYNLSHPEKSMILLAPLEKDAGGYGWCTDEYGNRNLVFRDKSDPDYQFILKAIYAAKERQERDKTCRPDLPGFRPNPHYVRWMKHWGILPETFDLDKDPVDVYAIDRAYWESLWHQPSKTGSEAN